MPTQHNGATMEEIKESIRQLQMELNCLRDSWTEQLTHVLVPNTPNQYTQPSINLTAVPPILPSILENIPALSLSPDDIVSTKDPEESPIATSYDKDLSHVNTTLLASYFRHVSHIASIGSFFYSNASTLYRLGIG